MPVAPSQLSNHILLYIRLLTCHVLAAPSRRSLLARHPFTNVGGTPCNANALGLALYQESHRLHIYEADFNQIEDDGSSALLVDKSAELGKLLGADSAAHGQRCRASVNGTNDPEHGG